MNTLLNQEITIIGSGKVASSLVHAFYSKDITIHEVYGRSMDKAKKLTDAFPDTQPTTSLDFSLSKSSVFILAVKDDAISEMVSQLTLPENAYLFHTSGTVSMEALAGPCQSYGIFYPLQTFINDQKVDFSEIPLLIDGNNQETTNLLMQLGQSLSKKVSIASETDRQLLHVAAVFASNFTNRMLAASKEILENTSLDYDILRPLVDQSVANAFENNPDLALTGPAKRGDQQTIKRHLDLIQSHPDLLKIYKQLTDFIIKN